MRKPVRRWKRGEYALIDMTPNPSQREIDCLEHYLRVCLGDNYHEDGRSAVQDIRRHGSGLYVILIYPGYEVGAYRTANLSYSDPYFFLDKEDMLAFYDEPKPINFLIPNEATE